MIESFFVARLTGRSEVPPVRTKAFGTAKFIVNRERTKLKYRLEVNDIENFIQAHIHFGTPNENGPILAFLFGTDAQTITDQEGITTERGVVKGILSDEDIVDNLQGIETIRELVNAMEEGQTYVNAHTEQNKTGEIRGQIMLLF